jgi:hypothetical protein
MLTQSEKPVVGPLHKSGGADSQKLSVATKFKVYQLHYDEVIQNSSIMKWSITLAN